MLADFVFSQYYAKTCASLSFLIRKRLSPYRDACHETPFMEAHDDPTEIYLLVAWTNLLEAYRKAARGKRGKTAAAAFEWEVADNLLALPLLPE